MIGHRGFCQAAPENTLPSFALAVGAGADLVELDVHQSKDGEWVVIHDALLDRTTDAVRRWDARRVRVADKSAAEIRALDAGEWFDLKFAGTRVPLLLEVIEGLPKHIVPLIEQKGGHGPDLIKFLDEHRLMNRVIVQSFNWEFLTKFHKQHRRQTLAALGPGRRLPNGKRPLGISRKLNRAWLDQAQKTGARIVVWSRKLSKGTIRLAHARGMRVWVYTVNDVRLARRLLRAGADGLITDNPLLIQKAVADGSPRLWPRRFPLQRIRGLLTTAVAPRLWLRKKPKG